MPATHLTRIVPLSVCLIATGLMTVACSSSDNSGGQSLPDQGAAIGGEVTGLGSDGLILALNNDETLDITTAGVFEFDTRLSAGQSYEVNIPQQPDSQHCEVINSTGTVDESDVVDIIVECPIELTAESDIMQVRLRAFGPEDTDIYYSSDPDCDWANHSLCDDAGSIIDAGNDQHMLGAVENGLDPDTGLFFIADDGELQSEPAAARPSPPGFGTIMSMTTTDDRIIVGGGFNRVLLATGGGVTLRVEDAKPVGALPAIKGVVHAVHADGNGGWYIGGDFDRVGNQPRENLAHIHANGAVNPDWHPTTNATVRALTVANDRVYIGGEFTQVENNDTQTTRNRLAAFDMESGIVDADWAPTANDRVLTLEAHNGLILAGGEFGEVNGGTVRASLAAFDADSGALYEDWNPGTNGSVLTIVATAERTYIGGEFTQTDGTTRHNIAVLNNDNGNVNPDWEAETNDEVLTIALSDDRVYVGGRFSEAGNGNPRELFAAFHRDTGTLDPDWQPNVMFGLSVRSLIHHEGHVYAGGSFTVTNEDDDIMGRLARLDAQSGALDPTWDIPISGSAPNALALSGNRLFAGGFIGGAGGPVRHRIAAFDRETGVLDPDIAPVIDDPREGLFFVFVRAVEVIGNRIYLGGTFQRIEGHARENIAAIDINTGELVADWNPGANNSISALAASSDRLYVGGNFTEMGADNQQRDRLAAFDINTGLLNTQWDPGADATVKTLVTDGQRVFVGGYFTTTGGKARNRIAALHADSGAADVDWDPGVSDAVNTLALESGTLYAGGRFTTAGETNADREKLAAFSADTGDLLSWAPSGTNSEIDALTTTPDRVYAGGGFSTVNGNDRGRIAAIETGTGSLVADWNPGAAAGSVRAVTTDANLVVIGGSFRQFNDRVRPGFALVDAETGELIW